MTDDLQAFYQQRRKLRIQAFFHVLYIGLIVGLTIAGFLYFLIPFEVSMIVSIFLVTALYTGLGLKMPFLPDLKDFFNKK